MNAGARFRLDGKVAVVTGASRGIGQSTAKFLGEAGADLVLVSRTVENLAATRKVCAAFERRVVCVGVDIAAEDAGPRIAEMAQREFGKVDVLVNNAGVSPTVRRAEHLTRADWNTVLGVNLLGTFGVTQAVGTMMLAAGRGSIVLVTSLGARIALFGLAAYCSTKGALDELTRCLAYEWSGRGVRVNAVAPGFVETDMLAELKEKKREQYDRAVSMPVLKRFADPDEIAGTVLFLASDEASYMTGQTILVDGGWTIW